MNGNYRNPKLNSQLFEFMMKGINFLPRKGKNYKKGFQRMSWMGKIAERIIEKRVRNLIPSRSVFLWFVGLQIAKYHQNHVRCLSLKGVVLAMTLGTKAINISQLIRTVTQSTWDELRRCRMSAILIAWIYGSLLLVQVERSARSLDFLLWHYWDLD